MCDYNNRAFITKYCKTRRSGHYAPILLAPVEGWGPFGPLGPFEPSGGWADICPGNNCPW